MFYCLKISEPSEYIPNKLIFGREALVFAGWRDAMMDSDGQILQLKMWCFGSAKLRLKPKRLSLQDLTKQFDENLSKETSKLRTEFASLVGVSALPHSQGGAGVQRVAWSQTLGNRNNRYDISIL